MGSSSKPAGGKGKNRDGKKKREIPEHTLTLRQRLREALSLGIKFCDNRERKWQCTNLEIMGLAVRSMSAFIGCVSSDLLQHPIIKDSISDMLVALEGILQSENETILSAAVNVTVKLFHTLGNSICQYQFPDVILPLLHLLSLRQSSISVSSAIALKCILTNVGPWTREYRDGIWKALEETNAVGIIINALHGYLAGDQLDYVKEMASFLMLILWRWPLSRYPVWSNTDLMAKLGSSCVNFDSPSTACVLELYSTLALCGDGTMEFLKNTEPVVSMMIKCMGSSQPHKVRIEALKLCQQLARSEKGCSMLTSLCCEPIVQGLIDAMGGWRSLNSKKVPGDWTRLVLEACRTSLITRWSGPHHYFFWNLGIDSVLLDLLLGKCSRTSLYKSPDDLKAAAYDNISDIRNYVWDILGWLAIHCEEDFHSKGKGKAHCIDSLISCACAVAVDLMLVGCHSKQDSTRRLSQSSELEPASRAVLLMAFSPCKYIASKARVFLAERLVHDGNDYLECLLNTLKLNLTGYDTVASDNLQCTVNLIGLVWYSCLPQYRGIIVKKEGITTLSAIVRRCLNRDINVSRSCISPHLDDIYNARTCCLNHVEDWECGNIFLLYSLQALSQLMCLLDPEEISFAKQSGTSETHSLFNSLLQIINNNFSREFKWYAMYCLSSFGLYGFPSRLGKRMEKSLKGNELVDVQVALSNGQSLGVHGVILLARCPSLLPHEDISTKDKPLHEQAVSLGEKLRHVVHLSDHVAGDALAKLLEYVYTGLCQVDDNLVRPLLILVKRCNVKSLSYLLQHKKPSCGTSIPRCDFTWVLGPAGHLFTDVILEAKHSEVPWKCSICQISIPHMHAHKIILCTSSPYLQALFRSGMKESHSKIIKVSICWEALVKLVDWFYSGELPKLNFNCRWKNMDTEQQFNELLVYVELSWLSEFWLLDDVGEESVDVVISGLRLDQNLSIKIINFAVNLDQWKIVEAAVSHLAPQYPHMRDTGDLENLSEEVIDMLRSEYVHYCQETHYEVLDI